MKSFGWEYLPFKQSGIKGCLEVPGFKSRPSDSQPDPMTFRPLCNPGLPTTIPTYLGEMLYQIESVMSLKRLNLTTTLLTHSTLLELIWKNVFVHNWLLTTLLVTDDSNISRWPWCVQNTTGLILNLSVWCDVSLVVIMAFNLGDVVFLLGGAKEVKNPSFPHQSEHHGWL